MSIRERIKAVYVLQRFVRMSRVLLPLYLDLKSKRSLSLSEESKIQGIRQVYDNFHANPETSKFLINSDILDLIQSVYSWVMSEKGHNPQSFHEYNQFIRESDRLISEWDHQLMN